MVLVPYQQHPAELGLREQVRTGAVVELKHFATVVAKYPPARSPHDPVARSLERL